MRFSTRAILTLTLAAAFALPAMAGDRSTPILAERRGDRFHRLERLLDCLPALELTETQRSEIRGILEAARTDFQAGRETVRTAREKLSADVSAGGDACLVGEDYLALHGALEALRTQLASVREQVLARLSADQAARLAGCLEAPRFED